MSVKRIGKQEREHKVLLGLVEYYIETGKPVGSNTLKEAGFEDLSSATIRNYFSHLEEKGFLTQSHSSGGRIPTNQALRTYAEHIFAHNCFEEENSSNLPHLNQFESREIALFLQNATEYLSQVTNYATFLSAPRFDHDFVVDMKLLLLDAFRCLCVLITDFGVIQTEVIQLPAKLSSFAIKRIESYFNWRLKGIQPSENLNKEEESIAQSLYNELLLRFIVSYSNFADEDIYRTGFSRLLHYPEFKDAHILSSSLSLFEDVQSMRFLLKKTTEEQKLKFWIGDDLAFFTQNNNPNCSVLTIPYCINNKPVGAVGILGPTRMPYQKLFNILNQFAKGVSKTLTRNIYKFKISFRQPEAGKVYLHKEEQKFIGQSRLILLEDQRDT